MRAKVEQFQYDLFVKHKAKEYHKILDFNSRNDLKLRYDDNYEFFEASLTAGVLQTVECFDKWYFAI